jgi:hypothetical protein
MIADIVPIDSTGLVILLLAIVPGYLTVATWGRRKTWKGRTTDLATVVESIAFSAVIQILALPLTLYVLYPYRDHLDAHEGNVAVWLAAVVLGFPIVAGTIWAWISGLVGIITLSLQRSQKKRWKRAGRLLAFVFPPTVPPSIWDLVYKENIPNGTFMVVTFDDGRQVTGLFHRFDGERSQATTSPQRQGLYLAKEYTLDEYGDILGLVPATKGVMIPSLDHIQSIRLLNIQGPGTSDGKQATNTEQSSTENHDPGRDQGRGFGHKHGAGRDSQPSAKTEQSTLGSIVHFVRHKGLTSFLGLIGLSAVVASAGTALRVYLRREATKP